MNTTEMVKTVAPVTLTSRAVEEIKRLRLQGQITEEKKLRIGVKGGGCSGLSYVLDFDLPGEGDEFYNMDGVAVVMNKSHELYLYGMTVDYESGLNARGFVFANPNAQTTCGCGTSFSA